MTFSDSDLHTLTESINILFSSAGSRFSLILPTQKVGSSDLLISPDEFQVVRLAIPVHIVDPVWDHVAVSVLLSVRDTFLKKKTHTQYLDIFIF